MAETWVSLMLSNPLCTGVDESTLVLRARFGLVNLQDARDAEASAVHPRRVALQNARDAEAQQCIRDE